VVEVELVLFQRYQELQAVLVLVDAFILLVALVEVEMLEVIHHQKEIQVRQDHLLVDMVLAVVQAHPERRVEQDPLFQ
jgi:hypothetical protein